MNESDYEQRIERTLKHIGANLDGNLSLEILADVACFSPHHFHRIYHAMVGETVAETVKRHRLHRAARELLEQSYPIERIAKRAGYTSQSAFTRAFRKAFGIPPGRYQGQTVALHRKMTGDPSMFDVEITKKDRLSVAFLSHKGSYLKIGTVFERLLTKAYSTGLVEGAPRTFGIYHDDPNAIAEGELRSQACLVVDDSWTASGDLEKDEIKGGRYACAIHVGPYAELSSTYDWLYGTWLPQSGEEADDRPVVEEYIDNPQNTPLNQLRTAIWVPIK